jgi:hypothetical protein
MYPSFVVKPTGKNIFFNEKFSRKLEFQVSDNGRKKIIWTRRGYKWELSEN